MPSLTHTIRPLNYWKSILRKRRPNFPNLCRMATTSTAITPIRQATLAPPLPIPVPKPRIKTYPPPPSTRNRFPDPIAEVNASHLSVLDPTGSRKRLFARSNPDALRPGDIILVTFKSGDQFVGVCLSVRRRGPDTGILLRNRVLVTGVELWVKVFSPTVQRIELVKKAERRIRRARLFYMRKPKHDRGSLENVLEQYLKARSIIRGGAVGKRDPKLRQQHLQHGQKRK